MASFDIFLSHNAADKDSVERIAEKLQTEPKPAFGYSASGSSTASAELSVTQAVWKYLICGSMP
jgi:hypothetical protein